MDVSCYLVALSVFECTYTAAWLRAGSATRRPAAGAAPPVFASAASPPAATPALHPSLQVDYELAPGSLRSAKEIFPASLVRAAPPTLFAPSCAGAAASSFIRPPVGGCVAPTSQQLCCSLCHPWHPPTHQTLRAGRQGGPQLSVRGGGALAAQGAVGHGARARAGLHPAVAHPQPALLHAPGARAGAAAWQGGRAACLQGLWQEACRHVAPGLPAGSRTAAS